MTDTAITVEGLGKRYQIGQREPYGALRDMLMDALRAKCRPAAETIWALKGVSFEIKQGEVVGIIGHNGAGKSTLLKILSRVTKPTEGKADIWGRVGSLLEVGTGFHPELTGRENIYLNGAILGMRKAEIARKFDEIVAFAETEQFLDTPVKHYSSGMRVRLAFAVAAHLEPEILLVDEVLAVGDAAFQKKCLGKMGDVAKAGRTILFVSHNMAAIQNLCASAFWLDHGTTAASGKVGPVVERYLKSVTASASTFLGDRKDRRGDGRLRFEEFSVTNSQTGDPATCGSPATLAIRYVGNPPLRNVQLSIGIFTVLGEGAMYLSNDLVGKQLDNLPAAGVMSCRVEKLPLLPGRYSVNLYCTINGVLADWVTDAARFDVGDGDFFHSGKLPPPGYGTVAVSQDWNVVL
ncbi:MAG TPA: ABC transporter ATP-binding protein [Verrucomicrobiae bacterium]|nr:ABC transporter ATP-binding protein [Verrucomicrobiae bacterium]